MKILLAVDSSPCSEKAVKKVAEHVWEAGSEVKIISAYEVPLTAWEGPYVAPEETYIRIEKILCEHATSTVKKASEQLRQNSDLTVATETKLGAAKAVIINEAELWKADLVVIGSHGYGAFKRLLFGSVSQAVAAYAPCPVLIVR